MTNIVTADDNVYIRSEYPIDERDADPVKYADLGGLSLVVAEVNDLPLERLLEETDRIARKAAEFAATDKERGWLVSGPWFRRLIALTRRMQPKCSDEVFYLSSRTAAEWLGGNERYHWLGLECLRRAGCLELELKGYYHPDPKKRKASEWRWRGEDGIENKAAERVRSDKESLDALAAKRAAAIEAETKGDPEARALRLAEMHATVAATAPERSTARAEHQAAADRAADEYRSLRDERLARPQVVSEKVPAPKPAAPRALLPKNIQQPRKPNAPAGGPDGPQAPPPAGKRVTVNEREYWGRFQRGEEVPHLRCARPGSDI